MNTPKGLSGIVARIVIMTSMFFITSCDDGDNNNPAINANETDFGQFAMNLPDGWTILAQQGYDSYVADVITSKNEVISFDLGQWSSSLNVDARFHNITHATIDGKDARIVQPKTIGIGVTGIFFADIGNGNRFQMSGNNLSKTSQNFLLASFASLRFK